MDSETNKKIEELQILESHLQGILAQKQTVQMELNEIENAVRELGNSGEEVYRVISGIMLKSEKGKFIKELEEKKKILEIKIGSVEKQEKLLEKDSAALREEISKIVSGKEKL